MAGHKEKRVCRISDAEMSAMYMYVANTRHGRSRYNPKQSNDNRMGQPCLCPIRPTLHWIDLKQCPTRPWKPPGAQSLRQKARQSKMAGPVTTTILVRSKDFGNDHTS